MATEKEAEGDAGYDPDLDEVLEDYGPAEDTHVGFQRKAYNGGEEKIALVRYSQHKAGRVRPLKRITQEEAVALAHHLLDKLEEEE